MRIEAVIGLTQLSVNVRTAQAIDQCFERV